MIKKFAEKLECDIPERLRPFVIAGIHGATHEKVKVTFPILPNGFPVLIHVYGDLPWLHVKKNSSVAPSRLSLAGQIYGTIPKMEIDGYFGQIGFLLHPTAPYYLFHLKGASFLNKWESLESTNLFNANKKLKVLAECESNIDRVPVLLKLLETLETNRLSALPWLDLTIDEIYKNNGSVAISELAEKANLSLRHYGRTFKEIIGVPPKYFCKVVQLNSIFEIINTTEAKGLLALALEYGYYDQSHFISDFKKLIGDSPEKFLMSEDAFVKSFLGRKGA